MRLLTALSTILLALAAATAQAQTPHTHQHSFGDAQKWAAVFDDPARDAWQKPHEVIEALALKPDAVVADIGAGTGYFALRLAMMAGKGRVYGVDLEPKMVHYLAERAKKQGIKNLTAVEGAPTDARLPAKVDLVLLVDTYHHINHREAYFDKLAASLKPGGRVAVIDFNATSKVGPPVSERITPDQLKLEMGRAGYRVAASHDFLPNQFFIVFERGAK
jgi:ubiquinone/menaquinone biosynthesis C-methylase UbiE